MHILNFIVALTILNLKYTITPLIFVKTFKDTQLKCSIRLK